MPQAAPAGQRHADDEAPALRFTLTRIRSLVTLTSAPVSTDLYTNETPRSSLRRVPRPRRDPGRCDGLCARHILSTRRLALDFHWELYPQAELVWDGEHAFDEPDSVPRGSANQIWPIAAILPVVPLTAVGPDAADWVVTVLVLASLVATLLSWA